VIAAVEPETDARPKLGRLAYKKREVAAACGVSIQTVWRWTASGRLHATAAGLITLEELQRFLRDEQEEE